ncbi:hypothetical protein OPT61_g6076 [Boeremia exigua]|uniref:Uncharacterized protein n=1 Tax=Boeremia exigua TaxID=749465 RepID=A0ACC2I811_9PLEO|nr:hypothetical protein OPT61_g6076 [Boeremia exigua]
MTGHIVFLTCLLAVCLPIVFVQLPRFDIVKKLRAENKAETRSAILRRRPLSPPPGKALRWSARPSSPAYMEAAKTKSEEETGDPEQLAQTTAGHQRYSRSPIFQGDASADIGASSREGLRTARGRKPWDPPFKRGAPATELAGEIHEENGHAASNISPPRNTGRGLEAKGTATRLFPPDASPEMDDMDEGPVASSRLPHWSQQPSYQHCPPSSQRQVEDSKCHEPFQEHRLKHPTALSRPLQHTDPESSRSPLDGSSPPPICHSSYKASSAKTTTPSDCYHMQCSHTYHNGCPSRLRSDPRAGPDNAYEACEALHPEIRKSAPEETTKDVKTHSHETGKSPREAYKFGLLHWQTWLVVMGLIIFIFAFAILVAHCLAWFLVYKTEARLGEVRSGLLRGGEMKLCLCGKG